MVQSRFHGERKPRNSAHLHCWPYTVLHETGFFVDPNCEVGFLHRNKDYIFGLSIPAGSLWYKEWIDAITIPWRKLTPNFLKSALSPCTALHKTGYFADRYCEVGFLHRNKDYIFLLSIPVAAFWYKECFGAITVPCRKEAPNFGKSALSALYTGLHETGYFADTAKWAFCTETSSTFLDSPFP